MSARLILYTDRLWESPYVFSVFVALREKGLAFEERELDLDRGEQRSADYEARSLTARVPCLEHGDFVLTESLAILEYLEEAFPAPGYPRLLPEGVRERARARQILGWLRSDLAALRDERPTTTLFYERAKQPLSEHAQAAADKLVRVAEQLLRPGQAALFGQFGYADADLAFMLHRLILNGDPVPERIRRYAEHHWARPSLRGYVEHVRSP